MSINKELKQIKQYSIEHLEDACATCFYGLYSKKCETCANKKGFDDLDDEDQYNLAQTAYACGKYKPVKKENQK